MPGLRLSFKQTHLETSFMRHEAENDYNVPLKTIEKGNFVQFSCKQMASHDFSRKLEVIGTAQNGGDWKRHIIGSN